MPKHNILRTTLLTGFLLMLAAVALTFLTTSSLEDVARKASERIRQKEAEISEIISKPQQLQDLGMQQFSAYYSTDNIGLYLFRNDTLIRWNNSRIPFSEPLSVFKDSEGFIKLKHGFYLYRKTTERQKLVAVALCLVKPL